MKNVCQIIKLKYGNELWARKVPTSEFVCILNVLCKCLITYFRAQSSGVLNYGEELTRTLKLGDGYLWWRRWFRAALQALKNAGWITDYCWKFQPLAATLRGVKSKVMAVKSEQASGAGRSSIVDAAYTRCCKYRDV